MNVENMPKTIPIEEREWFCLFAVAVAGKSAKQTQRKLNEYLGVTRRTPFETVQRDLLDGKLDKWLREFKFGQYKRIFKAWSKVIKLDVTKDLTVENLEAIPGIGPKTARFICLYTDPNFNGVPLDTHILKYLKEKYGKYETDGGIKIPKSTPPAGPKYNTLERLFQQEAEMEGVSVREFDTRIWKYYSGN